MGESRSDAMVTLPTPGNVALAPAGGPGESPAAAAGPVLPRPAYFDWRRFDPAIHPHEGSPMAEELTTHAERLEELLPHEGQFVLIKGREVVGIFPTRRAGLDAAVDRFPDEPAMVKRIVVLEPIGSIGNAIP